MDSGLEGSVCLFDKNSSVHKENKQKSVLLLEAQEEILLEHNTIFTLLLSHTHTHTHIHMDRVQSHRHTTYTPPHNTDSHIFTQRTQTHESERFDREMKCSYSDPLSGLFLLVKVIW